jgi:Uncharacterized protein conserved in bacteria
MSGIFENEVMRGWADFGGVDEETAAYRYKLGRTFQAAPEANEGTVLFVMLNPSTATAKTFDPTVRRCAGYAVDWGYRQLLVGNIFALRSTDPSTLGDDDAPYTNGKGTKNDRAILEMADRADEIVCAWGNFGEIDGRGDEVVGLLNEQGHTPKALRLNATGEPSHPLYLPKDLVPQPISMLKEQG